MLLVKSKDKECIVSCIGFYVQDAHKEFDERFFIMGIMATTGTPIELGLYEKSKAYAVLDRLQGAFGNTPTFNMP